MFSDPMFYLEVFITIMIIMVCFFALKYKRASEYEDQVKKQIKFFNPHCYLYDFNITMKHFHNGDTADVAAKAIIDKWQVMYKAEEKYKEIE